MESPLTLCPACGFADVRLDGHEENGLQRFRCRECGRRYNALVRAVRGTHEAYKADVRDPVHLERVAMVNNLCSWLKRCLWRFTGMEMRNLQSYLNWYDYLFRVKQAGERWPEIARVVRHLLMTETRFRSST